MRPRGWRNSGRKLRSPELRQQRADGAGPEPAEQRTDMPESPPPIWCSLMAVWIAALQA